MGMSLLTVLILVSSVTFGVAVGLGASAVKEALDRVNRAYLAGLYQRMERLGMDTSWLPLGLRLWWASAIATFLIVWLGLDMLPVAVMLTWLVYSLVPALLDARVDARRQLLRDQLVPAVRNLVSQVRAGIPLERGLLEVSRQQPDPLGALLRGVMNQVEQGRDFHEVLTEFKERVQIDGVSLFVIVLLTAHARGGDPSPVLERIGYSLEETQRVERKRSADTASGRLVVVLLGVFPFLFLGLYYLLDPGSTGLVFSLVAGQLVLCVVGLLVYGSVRWARWILRRVE
jgi:tight adherence protein B